MIDSTAPKLAQQFSKPEEILSINLKKLLKEYNLSEAELARQTGIPQPTIHKILTAKTEDPRISTLQSVASFFDITIDQLYSPSQPSRELHSIEVQSVPIISWSECLKSKNFLDQLTPTTWDKWLVIEHTSKHLYGLVTKSSMEPRFPKGSILIIDPTAQPRDGDLVIIHYENTDEATIREILIDGPTKLLLPLNSLASKESLNKNITILGTVVQSRFSY